MKQRLRGIFNRLYSAFGPQRWWPADSAFEVIVGAILTQNTSWANVEKAIAKIKENKCLNPEILSRLSRKKLAGMIKSAGYYNVKASRLKYFLDFFQGSYSAEIKRMKAQNLDKLRRQLLGVNGVGPETADSILLYALNKPVFVIDAYTKRIFSRHRILPPESSYEQAQDLFMRNLKHDVKMFNEYHALLVKLGKDYCRKSKPKCAVCPLHDK